MKKTSAGQAGFDTVGSWLGREHRSAVGKAMRTSDVRWEKVALLRNAIAKGRYSVSSGEIADKIMESMLCAN